MKYVFLSIEGNIGSGKSTLLKLLRETCTDYVFVDEPVDIWQSLKDEQGNDLLQLFYQDKNRWAYTLQNTAFITRYQNAKSALDSCSKNQGEGEDDNKVKVIISERSMLTDRFVFAEMLKADKFITPIEWDVYSFWYNLFSNYIPVTALIYITTQSNVCDQRIKIRGRKGEENISCEYLDELSIYHDRWIDSTTLPVLRLTNNSLEDVEKIKEFVNNLSSQV